MKNSCVSALFFGAFPDMLSPFREQNLQKNKMGFFDWKTQQLEAWSFKSKIEIHLNSTPTEGLRDSRSCVSAI